MLTLVMLLAAVATVGAALMVVSTKDLVHGVLWLAVSLLGTAVLYALLDNAFLAGVQVLTYVGGIVTLMVFGVMVTGKHGGGRVEAGSNHRVRAALTSLAFFGGLAWTVEHSPLAEVPVGKGMTVPELAHGLLGQYLFPFEVVSLLLLAAIIGAVVLARRRDVESGSTRGSRKAALVLGNLRAAPATEEVTP